MYSQTINGVERFMGLHPTPVSTVLRMKRDGLLQFSREHPKLQVRRPTADWIESSCRHFVKYVKDQGNQGACVGYSGSSAADITFAKQGLDIRTNPASLYAQINGGYDGGANCGDCLEALQVNGCLPTGFGGYGDLDWKAIYHTRFWDEAGSANAVEAAKYKAIEVVLCNSVADFFNALQTGQWAGQFCLGAGGAFETDADGFLGRYDGTGVNHALCATGGMVKNPDTGKWCVEGLNSWTKRWGLDGVFYCDESWLDVRGQEMWLMRSTTLPM